MIDTPTPPPALYIIDEPSTEKQLELMNQVREPIEQIDVVETLIRSAVGNIPDMALALAALIIENEEFKTVPPIHWRVSKRSPYTSGRCFWGQKIVITAGKDTKDALSTLVHELCHWYMGKGEHHSAFFFEELFTWYERYNCNIEYVRWREFSYKPETARLGYALYQRSVHGVRWRP